MFSLACSLAAAEIATLLEAEARRRVVVRRRVVGVAFATVALEDRVFVRAVLRTGLRAAGFRFLAAAEDLAVLAWAAESGVSRQGMSSRPTASKKLASMCRLRLTRVSPGQELTPPATFAIHVT